MKYDVAIVGASSAGLFAAERLARGGLRVAIFDRAVSATGRVRVLLDVINRTIAVHLDGASLRRAANPGAPSAGRNMPG